MGDNMRKCKMDDGSVAVMDGARITIAGMEEVSETGSSFKRRKLDHRGLQYHPSSSPDNPTTPAASKDSGQVSVGPCTAICSDRVSVSTSNGSNEIANQSLRSVDLEAEDFETENFTDDKLTRESTDSISRTEIYGDSEALDSPDKPSKPIALRRRSPAAKMPTVVEIDEFFAEAEKYDAKRFAEKYNYDIVKDVPLEGPYQWVLLKP